MLRFWVCERLAFLGCYWCFLVFWLLVQLNAVNTSIEQMKVSKVFNRIWGRISSHLCLLLTFTLAYLCNIQYKVERIVKINSPFKCLWSCTAWNSVAHSYISMNPGTRHELHTYIHINHCSVLKHIWWNSRTNWKKHYLHIDVNNILCKYN